jgi:hypothetical protein
MTDAMQGERVAGPALNAEVAERVMGLDLSWRRVTLDGTNRDLGPVRNVLAYSTDIAAAWRIVERMRNHPDARFRTLRLVAYPYNRTYATFDALNEDDWVEANGEHATPTAICLAALAVLDATPGQTPPNEG